MITEYKLSSADVDLRREMEALIHQDLETPRQAPPQQLAEGEEGAPFSAPSQFAPESVPAPSPELHDSADIDVHEVLAQQMGMEFVSLNDYPGTDYRVLRMITSDQARAYKVYPLSFDDTMNTLVLAVADPSNVTIVDDLSLSLGCRIDPVVAAEADIMDRINRSYGMGEETIGSMLEQFSVDGESDIFQADASRKHDLSDINEIINAAPVVKLTHLVLMKAIGDRASDIHIEPFESMLRIRYRVDGVLREMDSPPKDMQVGLISRLKVMADLDIAETRRPQDGRIKLALPDNREVDLRVASVPTVHGESIVMRVLDKTMMQIGIHEIGMGQDILEGFLMEVRKPNGIILVSGPTGSGKTTTLYAAINEVKTVEEKLITTEDPVEYQVDGIVQVNINEKVDLTYARCLRSILRQDPDRILVGEIRDLDTTKMAIEAALTGHLVFSTIHTNSAAGTVTRLIDMGIEPFLITSTLQAVIGQRLVRTICPNCKAPYEPSDEELGEFGVTRADVADIVFFHGEGCEECSYTGYKGRMGIFEFLKVNDEICDLIIEHATTDDIHDLAVRQGMITLRQDGWVKVCMGLTTIPEVTAQTPAEQFERVSDATPAEEPPVARPEYEYEEMVPPSAVLEPQMQNPHIPDGEAPTLHGR
ncbi:Flp pilus assembly complex ATPase component TadA [Candidatus Sumerlaeota bacterium]|nr:Flp pilus assembly complex ATPase component TadA [Candidatus Sumerlaeota bacterium]